MKLRHHILATFFGGTYIALLIYGYLHFSEVALAGLLILPWLFYVPVLINDRVPRWVMQAKRAYHKLPLPESGGALSREQALMVLGLDGHASLQDILSAHKRLMAYNHPDRGGSTYLAYLINESKKVLTHSIQRQRNQVSTQEL